MKKQQRPDDPIILRTLRLTNGEPYPVVITRQQFDDFVKWHRSIHTGVRKANRE